MENYHNFEFNRSKKAMRWFISIALVSVILNIALSILEDLDILPSGLDDELWTFCQKQKGTISIIRDGIMWMVQISYLPHLTLCYGVIYIRSDEDLLENVSTLSFLLKVSIFQRYRDNTDRIS